MILITMAENPKIIMRSLKNGTRKTSSLPVTTGFLASSLLKKRNNKKQMLQMKVKREKNEINFIKINVLKILSTK
jgi:hypothetical protein